MEESIRVAVYNLSIYLIGACVVAVFLLNKTRRDQLIQLRWKNFFVILVSIVVFAQSLKWSLVNYQAVINDTALSQIATMKTISVLVLLVECTTILMLMSIKYFKTKTPAGLGFS